MMQAAVDQSESVQCVEIEPLRVDLESFGQQDDRWIWRLRLDRGDDRQVLTVRLLAPGVSPREGDVADAAMVWLTPLAMLLGVPLEFSPSLPVDAELVERLQHYQPVLTAGLPAAGCPLREVPLDVPRRDALTTPPHDAPERVVAAAFSGGVDAHTQAAFSDPRPSMLLYVWGIDGEDVRPERNARVESRIREAARCHDMPVGFVETNLHPLLFKHYGFRRLSILIRFGVHGAGHLLARRINTFTTATDFSPSEQLLLFAASQVEHESQIIANYPPVVEMTTSIRVRQEYWSDGRTRMQRVAALAGVPGALSTVWICQQEAKGKYHGKPPNCGRCEKCQRTLAELAVSGVHDEQEAFDHQLDPELIAALPPLTGFFRYLFWMDILGKIRAQPGRFPALERSVQALTERSLRPDWAPEESLADPEDLLAGDLPLEDLREHPGYPQWLREHGAPLAQAVFEDRPARRALQWLAHPLGREHFRLVVLRRLNCACAGKLGSWLRGARLKQILRISK